MKTKTLTIKIPVIALPKVTMPFTITRNPDFKMPKLPTLKAPFKFTRRASGE